MGPVGLAEIRLRGGLGPQVLLGLIGHDLAVHEVADTGENDEEQQLLHGAEPTVPGNSRAPEPSHPRWRGSSVLESRSALNSVEPRWWTRSQVTLVCRQQAYSGLVLADVDPPRDPASKTSHDEHRNEHGKDRDHDHEGQHHRESARRRVVRHHVEGP